MENLCFLVLDLKLGLTKYERYKSKTMVTAYKILTHKSEKLLAAFILQQGRDWKWEM